MNTDEKLTRKTFLEKTGKAAAVLAVAGSVPLVTGCKKSEAEFDIIIKGGTVYDGTFAKPKVIDIGIKGDTITALGELTGTADAIIDAKGLIVTPGFIDVHTHCDLTFKRTGWQRHLARFMPSWKGNYNYLYQGVTTVVTGNCGYGYTDLNEWFGIADSIDFGTNVYHLAPHGIIREELFGEKQPRDLSAAQLDQFKKKVAEEMEKGCIGFSTGLEYAPGLYSTTAELIELAKVVQKYDGLYATHMRDESGKIYDDGEFGIIKSIKEAIEIGRQAGIPVEISHLKISAPLNNANPESMLELIEQARREGLEVTADQYPYAAGSTQVTFLLPNEFKTSIGVKDEYKTKEGRVKMKEAIEKVFETLKPEKTLITMYPEREELEGKTIKEIADSEGKKPSEVFVEMAVEDQAPMAVFFFQDINVVRALMPRDYILTASDGWTVPKDMTKPHPRVYGTFPKKIRQFVLEEKLMSLTGAIRSMTSLPAEKFRMKGRGRIAEGNFADIAVINLETITDHATFTDPHQYSEGVEYLLVNGVLSIDKGKATGDRGGRPIRRV